MAKSIFTKMKLEEGKEYSFYVEALISIPNEGDFYRLRYGSNKKILLKAEYYVNYNISIDNQVVCIVDKINCAGKIFLEPKHPYYTIGETYPFSVCTVEPHSQIENFKSGLFVVDFFNNIILVDTQTSPVEQKELFLKVVGIKKGRPILEAPNVIQNQRIPTVGSNDYLFTGNRLTVANEVFLELKSDSGEVGHIIERYYSHYTNIYTGEKIQCSTQGFKYGMLLLEPTNPWYQIGNTYWFSLNKIEYSDATEAFYVELLDNGGKKCGLQVNSEPLIEKIKAHKGLNCKVLGFRKGRPRLEVGEDNF